MILQVPLNKSTCLPLQDAADADVRTHLLRVMASTNERLLKSFTEAISAEVFLGVKGGSWITTCMLKNQTYEIHSGNLT